MSYKKDIFNKKRVTTRRSITGWLSRMAQGVSLSSTCTSPQAPVLFQVFKRKKFHLNSQIIKAMLFSFNDRFIADLLKITPLFHCKIITSGSGLNFKRLKDKDQTCDFAQFWKHWRPGDYQRIFRMSDFSKPRVNGKMLPSFQGRTVCLLGNAKDVSRLTVYLSYDFFIFWYARLFFSTRYY